MDALSHYHLGQEYAATAGRLLEHRNRDDYDDTVSEAFAFAQLAQAHATLAHVGVTALHQLQYHADLPPEELSAWFEAVSQAAPIPPETDGEEAPRRYWAVWTTDRRAVIGVVSGADLTSADAALKYATHDGADFEWTKAHSFVEEIDGSRFEDLLGWDEKTLDAKARLRPSPVGMVSPTDPAALGAWLRKLPLRSIVRDQHGTAWQRDTGFTTHWLDDGARSEETPFPALLAAGSDVPFNLEEPDDGTLGDLVDLAIEAPFTVLAVGAQDGGSDG